MKSRIRLANFYYHLTPNEREKILRLFITTSLWNLEFEYLLLQRKSENIDGKMRKFF